MSLNPSIQQEIYWCLHLKVDLVVFKSYYIYLIIKIIILVFTAFHLTFC